MEIGSYGRRRTSRFFSSFSNFNEDLKNTIDKKMRDENSMNSGKSLYQFQSRMYAIGNFKLDKYLGGCTKVHGHVFLKFLIVKYKSQNCLAHEVHKQDSSHLEIFMTGLLVSIFPYPWSIVGEGSFFQIV